MRATSEPLEDATAALQARIAELEAQVPAPEPKDPTTGYGDSDRVTVLHGWPEVHGKNAVTGKSKSLTWFVDGVARNVLYSDAVEWRALYGKNKQSGKWNITILPPDADLPEFARATGIQPMELDKLAAMIDAVDTPALVAAWGSERALRFAERVTSHLATAAGANTAQR